MAELPLSRVDGTPPSPRFSNGKFRTSLTCKRHAPQLGTFPSSRTTKPRLHLEHPATRRPIQQTATMDSDSVKKAIIRQALQATNTANARTLIEVRRLWPRIPDPPLGSSRPPPGSLYPLALDANIVSRTSTRSASSAASPSRAAPSRAASRHASHRAWRSTWRHGTRSMRRTSGGYSRRLAARAFLEVIQSCMTLRRI